MNANTYPDKKILRLLIVRAAGGDARLAGLAMLDRDWENPIHSIVCAMRDARAWARGERIARAHWARRGVAWLAAGEDKKCPS